MEKPPSLIGDTSSNFKSWFFHCHLGFREYTRLLYQYLFLSLGACFFKRAEQLHTQRIIWWTLETTILNNVWACKRPQQRFREFPTMLASIWTIGSYSVFRCLCFRIRIQNHSTTRAEKRNNQQHPQRVVVLTHLNNTRMLVKFCHGYTAVPPTVEEANPFRKTKWSHLAIFKMDSEQHQ